MGDFSVGNRGPVSVGDLVGPRTRFRSEASARALARVPGTLIVVALGIFTSVAIAPVHGGEPAIAGYRDHAAYLAEVVALDALDGVEVEVIGRTAGGREIHAIAIGEGDLHEKPAIAILGNVHAPHLAGAEMALAVARRIAEERARGEPRARAALARATLYVIPRPTPDATEAFFRAPYHDSAVNDRPADDDRDGAIDEDPPEDLDGDGWITSMRVRDPRGRFIPHPEDPRVMVEADPLEGERGLYRVLVEGVDQDGDERWNEDGPGGVAFDRNFTFRYPYFEAGAGPHQVSEPETRAVADFLFGRRGVAVVFAFSPEDNLFHPWKPDPGKEKERVKEAVLEADARYLGRLGQRYRELHGGKDAPPAARGAGSFVDWAYFHYGRFSLAGRGYFPPKLPAATATSTPGTATSTPGTATSTPGTATSTPAAPVPAASATSTPAAPGAGEQPAEPPAAGVGKPASTPAEPPKPADAKPGDAKPGEKKPGEKKPDERAAEVRSALRGFDRDGLAAFSPWRRIEHPDFPGQEVEVGGLRPFFLLNPPVATLTPLLDGHARFALELLEALPRLRVEAKRVPLEGGLYRIEAVVLNEGLLPTASAIGASGRLVEPLIAEITLPAGARLLEGVARRRLEPIAGGGFGELSWLLWAPEKAGPVRVRAGSPIAGAADVEVELP